MIPASELESLKKHTSDWKRVCDAILRVAEQGKSSVMASAIGILETWELKELREKGYNIVWNYVNMAYQIEW